MIRMFWICLAVPLATSAGCLSGELSNAEGAHAGEGGAAAEPGTAGEAGADPGAGVGGESGMAGDDAIGASGGLLETGGSGGSEQVGGGGAAPVAGAGGLTGAGGATGGTTQQGGAAPLVVPPGHRPSMVVVGWGGLRVASFDLGVTWTNRVADFNRNDEGSLLREVIFADGLYVAVGGTIYTSPDGIKWNEPVPEDIGWYGGVAHGNGVFVAGGACGSTLISRDRGKSWQTGTDLISRCDDHIRSIVFVNGMFMASDDAYAVHVSSDGVNWTIDPQLRHRMIATCGGMLKERDDCPNFGHGVYLRGGGPTVDRSLNGTLWKRVHEDTNKTMRFAFGYSPM